MFLFPLPLSTDAVHQPHTPVLAEVDVFLLLPTRTCRFTRPSPALPPHHRRHPRNLCELSKSLRISFSHSFSRARLRMHGHTLLHRGRLASLCVACLCRGQPHLQSAIYITASTASSSILALHAPLFAFFFQLLPNSPKSAPSTAQRSQCELYFLHWRLVQFSGASEGEPRGDVVSFIDSDAWFEDFIFSSSRDDCDSRWRDGNGWGGEEIEMIEGVLFGGIRNRTSVLHNFSIIFIKSFTFVEMTSFWKMWWLFFSAILNARSSIKSWGSGHTHNL